MRGRGGGGGGGGGGEERRKGTGICVSDSLEGLEEGGEDHERKWESGHTHESGVCMRCGLGAARHCSDCMLSVKRWEPSLKLSAGDVHAEHVKVNTRVCVCVFV